MRKIFLDCGANNGCSVRKFKKIVSDWGDYEIFSFEANEVFYEDIENTGVNLIKKAVWIADTEVDFFVVSNDRYGNKDMRTGASTLCQQKNKWNLQCHKEVQIKKVEAIDLSTWILKNFSKQDNIILKMDIEGSEYDVLEKMIKDSSIYFINELWIEFHQKKSNIDKNRHDKLNKFIDSLNIKIDRQWNAM
tara:strand:- start:11768 stop:12340 length:573 start_codon:yes stop_codon:yes gene_type:complete